MVLQAGVVLARPGYIKLKFNSINVFATCSLLIAGTMLCHTVVFQQSFHLKTIIYYKFKVALFTYKIINNISNVPNIFKRTLNPACEVHSYDTRFVSNQNLYWQGMRNSYGAATFAFVGSKVWENIPSKLKTLPYNSFYQQYKLYLLSTQ